jgi:hypothetical protein
MVLRYERGERVQKSQFLRYVIKERSLIIIVAIDSGPLEGSENVYLKKSPTLFEVLAPGDVFEGNHQQIYQSQQ